MDFNSYLSETWFHVGHYNTKSFQINRNRFLMNRVCFFIYLIFIVKYIFIICDFSENNKLRYYLVGYYLFEGSAQKLTDLGCLFMKLNIAYNYHYWANVLNKELKLLRNLDYLFISNYDVLIKRYDLDLDLDRKAIEQFVKKAKVYTFLVKSIALSCDILFTLLTVRCFYYSLAIVNFYYLFTIGLFFGVTNVFGFYLLFEGK